MLAATNRAAEADKSCHMSNLQKGSKAIICRIEELHGSDVAAAIRVVRHHELAMPLTDDSGNVLLV
jgi:hypothetical protein